MTGEFELIERLRRRLGGASGTDDLLCGIGDDAAVIQPPAGEQLVITSDTMNAGTHFLESDSAGDIGHKILAVNLSDLAAMAAAPRWALLNLALPAAWSDQRRVRWFDGVLDGLAALLTGQRIRLVGGDTTSGPLALTMTLIGTVPAGRAIYRSGARPGDHVLVSGSLGDAAAAWYLLQQNRDAPPSMLQKLRRPAPRVALGLALRGLATAMIDISDGLLADLQHILRASAAGAVIRAEAVPRSGEMQQIGIDKRTKTELVLAGGEDYELCCTVPESRLRKAGRAAADAGAALTDIGTIVAEQALRCLDARGRPLDVRQTGWDHFR